MSAVFVCSCTFAGKAVERIRDSISLTEPFDDVGCIQEALVTKAFLDDVLEPTDGPSHGPAPWHKTPELITDIIRRWCAGVILTGDAFKFVNDEARRCIINNGISLVVWHDQHTTSWVFWDDASEASGMIGRIVTLENGRVVYKPPKTMRADNRIKLGVAISEGRASVRIPDSGGVMIKATGPLRGEMPPESIRVQTYLRTAWETVAIAENISTGVDINEIKRLTANHECSACGLREKGNQMPLQCPICGLCWHESCQWLAMEKTFMSQDDEPSGDADKPSGHMERMRSVPLAFVHVP